MSDTSQGPGWWMASDGKWYPPELFPEGWDPPAEVLAAQQASGAAAADAPSAEPSAEPAVTAEPEPEAAPETPAEPELSAEPGTDPGAPAEPLAEPAPVVSAEPEPGPATEADIEPEPGPAPEADIEPEPEPGPEPEVSEPEAAEAPTETFARPASTAEEHEPTDTSDYNEISTPATVDAGPPVSDEGGVHPRSEPTDEPSYPAAAGPDEETTAPTVPVGEERARSGEPPGVPTYAPVESVESTAGDPTLVQPAVAPPATPVAPQPPPPAVPAVVTSTPAASKRPRPSVGAVIAVVGAIAMIVGSVLEWASPTVDDPDAVSQQLADLGLAANETVQVDAIGPLSTQSNSIGLLAAGVVALLASALLLLVTRHLLFKLVAVLAAVVGVGLGVYSFLDLNDLGVTVNGVALQGISFDIGVGLWLALAGSAVAAIGALVAPSR